MSSFPRILFCPISDHAFSNVIILKKKKKKLSSCLEVNVGGWLGLSSLWAVTENFLQKKSISVHLQSLRILVKMMYSNIKVS